MDSLTGLLLGLKVAVEPINFFYCFVGVFIGTLIGVLPGIGPVGTIAILLPFTYGMAPVTAVILLAGIFYGAMYGGSTTSILINIPGESASIVTCIDGYEMAKAGRAGPALGICAFGSFIGGTLSIIGLILLANPLAEIAVNFGPAEYFALICMGLTILSHLSKGSFLKAITMALFGLILSTVGQDMFTGSGRFVFGIPQLLDGICLVPLVMGFFGISEVLINLEKSLDRLILEKKISNLLPNWGDWKRSIGPIFRGSFLGFTLGLLPGGGAIISTFASYSLEKRISKHPEEFGKGAIEGVAGPESANNAATGGSFIPLFALGIPSTVIMALLFGALLIHGILPGPLMITQHPKIFWGTIASMYLGNGMLLLLNLPLIGIWVRLLKVPYRILFPLILLFTIIGSYSINNSSFDLLVMVIAGTIGYFLVKAGYEPAPCCLAYVLGGLFETNFRQALLISGGKVSIFLTRPVSAILLAIAIFIFIYTNFSYYRKLKVILVRKNNAGENSI
jgi:putative tricarboxylic transport membrane protein